MLSKQRQQSVNIKNSPHNSSDPKQLKKRGLFFIISLGFFAQIQNVQSTQAVQAEVAPVVQPTVQIDKTKALNQFSALLKEATLETDKDNQETITKITFSESENTKRGKSPRSEAVQARQGKYSFLKETLKAFHADFADNKTFLQLVLEQNNISPNAIFVAPNHEKPAESLEITLFELATEIGTEKDIHFLLKHKDFCLDQKDSKGRNIFHILVDHKKFSTIQKDLKESKDLAGTTHNLLLQPDSEDYTPIENIFRNAHFSDALTLFKVWPELINENFESKNVDHPFLTGASLLTYSRSPLFMVVQGWTGALPPDEMDNLKKLVQYMLALGADPWQKDSVERLPIQDVDLSSHYNEVRSYLRNKMNEQKQNDLFTSIVESVGGFILTSITHTFLRGKIGKTPTSLLSMGQIALELFVLKEGIQKFYRQKIPNLGTETPQNPVAAQ